ncbi:restriction endonuclease subunit S [Escherichia coli]|uniref:restriction endonuclease subunit S n=1 Tax=Escherichia coli TaxID=562 RepID=UPI000DDF8E60|nr:restriction endonuclease subunit S [Escherichia coli]MBH9635499.1 restriction endonuclease subunit S [Escherichia coli]HCJ6017938.1 restriction endonuclease subunit S [Escherichia coli]HCJ6019373.1 restriction endonuclease subunit S [Escherichia coli]HCJ9105423.1 restriction endonuclease subunit S [Escherichia coli]HCJ9105970.1 restriction endonuclease subunit S [Escherichia coli]
MSSDLMPPKGWIVSDAQSYCTKIADGTHDSPKQSAIGNLLVTSKNIIDGELDLSKSYFISEEDYSKINRRSKVDKNDVLLSMIGTVGQACVVEQEPNFAIKNVGLLKNDDPIKAKWLYFYLSSPKAQQLIKERLKGTTQQYLSLGEIRKLPVFYPESHDVMKRVVYFLDSLRKKIIINNSVSRTLEQMAQALFKSWFVDFEPVKAKVAVMEAGGSQEDATLAAMTAISGKNADALVAFEREHPEQYAELKATAELFPAAMQDSELGAIPKGWGVASISEMGKVTCGKTPSKKEPEYYGSDVPFIKIPDMHGQLFVLKTNEYLSEAGSKSQLKKLVPANSICVSCIATIGVVSITNEPSHTNQQINSVTPHKSSLLYYLYFCMLGLKDHLHILGSAGSATLNVNTSTFSGIKIAQPDAKVLELFHAKCTHLFNEIKSLSVQTESLTQLRDTLLPKLLSGEITLQEAEQAVSEVENV